MDIKLGNIDILKDERVSCYSLMTKMSVKNYVELVNGVYQAKGGIEGQRQALKTNTAIRIRKRLLEDLKAGAVFPPVVLGLVLDPGDFNNFFRANGHGEEFKSEIERMLSKIPDENIAIIDGMQRTTALLEVLASTDILDKDIRVEFWIASNTNSLIYRMLVLNTGQVPWNIRRQLEVVFRSLLHELKVAVPEISLIEVDNPARRKNAGEFQADQIIELFLAFGARKEKIDTKERLADEFTRLDFIEATGEQKFTELFYEVIKYMIKLDQIFSRCILENEEDRRFDSGKDLFASQPVRIGFTTAIAIEVQGRPGMHYTTSEQQTRWENVKTGIDQLIEVLTRKTDKEIETYIDFPTLNETTERKSGKTGDFEREFFLKAFKVFIEENSSLENMAPCWRAY